ncbi:MAG: M23 family metallopeptidase [Alistipes sp.]|nr:M23 family metallopeptidase [Alistipes sp.]MBQ8651707.1 M23 family metallopeptidase [Alistipes sp.]
MAKRIPHNTPRKHLSRKQQVARFVVSCFAWLGAAILYYLFFSIFVDTPMEYELKHRADRMKSEYEALEGRYDTLMLVLENLSERDRGVFRSLFESDPYNFDTAYAEERDATYEAMFSRSTRRLKRDLRDRTTALEKRMEELNESYRTLHEAIERRGTESHNIPSIQPVINPELSLLTTSYGMRIHPFYKTLTSHQGVDYAIPEGSRVFATADGKVKEVRRSSTQGQTVIIDHGNGYETSYSHLQRISVVRNQQVRRGDIIALSGDTGLSLAPHLHYEVRLNGMRVDPIHYFFQELNPIEYERLIRIAQSGMQAFD